MTQPESLADVEAIALFLERARARQPDFGLTQDTAPVVADICQRLEGLPLAIELAAARLGAMSLQEITRKLDDSLHLLNRGSRTVPRQETLRATLDWSQALLSDAERMLFRRVSVFAGDFGARAAQQICSDDQLESTAQLTLLTMLVDKSPVEARVHGAEARYRLLEPVRQYAWEHLLGRGEAADMQRRHARYYADLAEAAEPELMSADRSAAIDRLVADEDNLRAALTSAPFYGSAPRRKEALRRLCPVVGSWPDRDSTSGAAATELTAAGIPHDIKVYAGARHSFFNDRGGNYHPAAAEDAWQRVLTFFGEHIAGERPQ